MQSIFIRNFDKHSLAHKQAQLQKQWGQTFTVDQIDTITCFSLLLGGTKK